jgi:hypothetical protein
LTLEHHSLPERRLPGKVSTRERIADDRDVWGTTAIVEPKLATGENGDTERSEVAGNDDALLRLV